MWTENLQKKKRNAMHGQCSSHINTKPKQEKVSQRQVDAIGII